MRAEAGHDQPVSWRRPGRAGSARRGWWKSYTNRPTRNLPALAANALADEYTTQNLDLRLDTIQKNLRWLSDEVVKQEKKVSDAEAAMTKYREDQNALSLGDRQNITIARLNALNETVTRQRTERMQKEATYNQLKSVDPASDAADGFPVVAANPGVVETKTRLTDLLAEQDAPLGEVPAQPPGDSEDRHADQERARDPDRPARARDRDRARTST